MTIPLVALECASAPGVADWTWELNPGELHVLAMDRGDRWAAVADLLLGRRRPIAGAVQWPALALAGPARAPADLFGHVPFACQSRAFSPNDYFLGQRYHAGWADEGPKVGEFIGCSDGHLLKALELEELLGRSLISLSSGQMRRVRLARALVSRPAGVILEDPLAGMDARRRVRCADLLGRLCGQGLAAVVLVARHEDFSGNARRLCLAGNRFELIHASGNISGYRVEDISLAEESASEPVLEFRNIGVRYGASQVLRDFSWTIRRGDRWHLAGENGAGKSTLLALAWGDHPQVFGNDIRLFGRRRGEGQTLWEAREPMTWHAPEVHAHFQEHLTVRQAITTGVTGSFAPPEMGRIDQGRLERLIGHLALGEVADRPYRQLPGPVQRVALVGRALFKLADLILLDEPHQGLAKEDRIRVNSWLEKDLRPNQALVFATHEAADRPAWLNRSLNLDNKSG